MTAPKLCKDCRWFRRGHGLFAGVNTDRCNRPGNIARFTELGRSPRWTDFRTCGPNAHYFTPRPPSRLRRVLFALGLASLPGCAADADAILVAAAVLAPLWVLAVARHMRRRWA